jgi:dihydroflavonol-4-reductase
MDRTLITGATGLVGFNTAKELLAAGRQVRAAVRSVSRARGVLPEEIELVEADVCDRASIARAMEGCSRVFHCAGIPEQWLPDTARFQEVHVAGTQNLIDAALAEGAQRFVYVSTIDVFAADTGAEFDESRIDEEPKGTAYERSKQDADRLVVAAVERGLPAVFVHPAAVFGPGPTGSRGINDFFLDLRDRKIPGILPGGMPIVYGPDLGRGLLLAEDSEIGSRYIFCDDYFSLKELATLLVAACPSAKVPLALPIWVARLLSEGGEAFAKIRKKPPLIPRGQLVFLQWQAKPQSTKAIQELGWTKTPTAEAIAETMRSLA